jgi:hypothetical protein
LEVSPVFTDVVLTAEVLFAEEEEDFEDTVLVTVDDEPVFPTSSLLPGPAA